MVSFMHATRMNEGMEFYALFLYNETHKESLFKKWVMAKSDFVPAIKANYELIQTTNENTMIHTTTPDESKHERHHGNALLGRRFHGAGRGSDGGGSVPLTVQVSLGGITSTRSPAWT